MDWIDVAIPGVFGLLLVFRPRFFIKSSGNVQLDAGRERKLRGIGILLLVVAGGYLLVKLASGR